MRSRIVEEPVSSNGMVKLHNGMIVLLDPEDSDCGTVIYSDAEAFPIGTTMSALYNWDCKPFNGIVEITS